MRHILRLLGFVRPHKKIVIIAYAALIFSTLASLAMPRLLGTSIDKILDKDTFSFLIFAATGVFVFSMAHAVFLYAQRYFGEVVAHKVAYDLRNTFYNHLQHMSFAYHDKQQTGQLMSRATADIESIRWFISFGLIRSLYLILLLSAISILLITTSWKLGLIALVSLPFLIVRATLISRKMRVIYRRIQAMTGDLGAVMQENLSSAMVVRAFSREEFEKEKFGVKSVKLAEENIVAAKLHATQGPFIYLVFALLTCAILWFGGRDVISGSLSPGELTEFFLYLAMLAMPIRISGWMITLFSRAASSAERIFYILDAVSPVQELPTARPIENVRGQVAFNNVSFSYDAAGPALSDISFQVEPGQVVALLGATGSGKTTIVHLIPRFYDVNQGSLTIDGVDIRDVTLRSLRLAVGIVQQEVFLFADTLKENLAYGAQSATMEDIERAVEAARLKDFIASSPEGYGTRVGERGITLSGGQKQRVAIARTLLMDPRILILDDSTASVDTETEMLIQQALKELIKGRTTFIIAQRLSTVRNADLVLVLDKGRIAEQGTHSELLANGGIYTEIYDLQFRPQEEQYQPAPPPTFSPLKSPAGGAES